MSEMTDTPDTGAPSGLDFDAWLASGTVARRSVTIYNDPALATEFDALDRKLKETREADEAAGRAEDDPSTELQEILRQMEDLHERWEASKATFIVRALTIDEVEEIRKKHPGPNPLAHAGEKIPERGTTAHQAWLTGRLAEVEEADQAEIERGLEQIAAAVVEVRTPAGSAESISVDQVRALRARPQGKLQTGRLLTAISELTTTEVEIPRPTWPGRSETARD